MRWVPVLFAPSLPFSRETRFVIIIILLSIEATRRTYERSGVTP
jgi:hypothetical protein